MNEPGGTAEFGLVMPFVVVTSKGGPYQDDAFVAGFQCGTIAASLELAMPLNVDRLFWPIFRTALAPQIDLLAMRFGFHHVEVVSSEEWPEWATLTITREAPSDAE